jgi:hypothetical protein
MGGLGEVFQGRPRGRIVDCNSRRFAVRACHESSPNGALRTTDRHGAANSASFCGDRTRRSQFRGKHDRPVVHHSRHAVDAMPKAGPSPLLGPLHQVRAQRIALHLAQHRQ